MSENLLEKYGFADVEIPEDDTPDFTNFMYHVSNIDNRPNEENEAAKDEEPETPVTSLRSGFIPYDPQREVVLSDSLNPPKKKGKKAKKPKKSKE